MKLKIMFFMFSFTFINCQKEDSQIIDNSHNASLNSLVSNSPLVSLVSRTVQNPTALDNVLDKSSCFSIQLPVTVIVNNVNIVVSSINDYQTVQDAIDAFSTDDDIVNFIYPISIKYKNFSTQVISNNNTLDNVLDQCDEDNGFNEIDCISINYPIIINSYDTNNQIANTVTFSSNSQLFNYLISIDSQIISTIVYPISVTNSSGQNVLLNSNSELENFISDSIDDCNNSSVPSPTFVSVLTSGNWRVSYFYEDYDETSDYNGYVFTFNSNYSIEVVKNSISSSGSWNFYNDSGTNKINLTFSNLNLDELQEDWNIIEYSQTYIRLKHVSGGNGGTDYLYFTKN